MQYLRDLPDISRLLCVLGAVAVGAGVLLTGLVGVALITAGAGFVLFGLVLPAIEPGPVKFGVGGVEFQIRGLEQLVEKKALSAGLESGDAKRLAAVAVAPETDQAMSLPSDAFLSEVSSNPEALTRIRDEALDDFVVAALSVRLGEEDLARDWYQTSLAQVLRDKRQRHNYRVTISIESIRVTEDAHARTSHFDAYIHRRYETRLQKPCLSFVVVESGDDYASVREGGHWDVVTTAAPRSDFPTLADDVLDRELFELEYVKVNGTRLSIDRVSDPRLAFTASADDLEELIGTMATVDYRYRHRISKRRHSLTNYIAFPTTGASITFEANAPDMQLVGGYPLFVSHHRPTVRYPPHRDTQDKVEVEVGGWVLPGSGVAFVWRLVEEGMQPGTT